MSTMKPRLKDGMRAALEAVAAARATGQKVAVIVHQAQGEYLHYVVEAEGGNSEFVFGCAHREALKQADPIHPKQHYEWDWFRGPGESDSPDDIFHVVFLFVGVLKYHLVIDHRRRDGSVIEPLQDRTLEDDGTGSRFTTLHVFTDKEQS